MSRTRSPQPRPCEASASRAGLALHLLPWLLFLAVAFRLLPQAWQFEQWSKLARDLATLSFGLFVLIDTGLIAWKLAFGSETRQRAA